MVGIGWHFLCQNVRIDASKRKHENGHLSLYLYGLWAFLKKITESSKQGCFGSEDRCSIQLSYGRNISKKLAYTPSIQWALIACANIIVRYASDLLLVIQQRGPERTV
jgi:hypothetical protein